MTRVLITGGFGFIGSHLGSELQTNGYDVHLSPDKHVEDLGQPGVFQRQLEEVEPDIVIHLAAQVGRLKGEDDLLHTVRSNAEMTTLVAHACGADNVRLVYASTSEVYGDQGEAMCYEEGPLKLPHNYYGVTKRWGEEACRLYAPRQLTVWRISMPYGPGLPAGRGRAALVNFLWSAYNRQSITVHRGSERSWCWIGDTVRGMRMTLDLPGGVWNVGRDDNATTMLDVAKRACALTGAPHSLIVEIDPPGAQTVVKRLSTAKLEALGWEPEVELDEGMRRTLDYMVENGQLA